MERGGVVRVNVATLKDIAFGTITKRLDVASGSSLGFRLRPHNRRDPEPGRDRQKGTKKSVRAGANGRKKGVCLYLICLTTFCNNLLVKQVLRPRIACPLCDGCPFASPFRRLSSRGLFFFCSYVAPSYCGHYR